MASPESGVHDGSWLCEDGLFRRLASSMKAIDPMVTTLDRTGAAAPTVGQAQVALIEVHESGSAERLNFSHAHDLSTHLSCRPVSKAHDPKRRIYIMEGMAPDFVSAFGDHFLMEPSFFSRHQRTIYGHLQADCPGDIPPLPSSVSSQTTFLIKYYELRYFPKSPELSRNYYIACADTGRRVAFQRVGGELKTVGIVRRKCSYWGRNDKHGGWDIVILCDPTLRRIKPLSLPPASRDLSDANCLETPNVPYKGGYIGFVEPGGGIHLPGQMWLGPPRTSMIEDLCFYYEQHRSDLWHNGPQRAADIVKKIAASQYMQLLDYLKALLGNVEWHLSFEYDLSRRTPADALIDARWLASQWENQMTLGRRLHEYCDDCEEALLNLGIFPLTSISAQKEDFWDCQDDFIYISGRLSTIKARANQLTSSLGVLAGLHESRAALAEAKRSSREGKRIKALTLVGLIFIPLVYTCALFSMNEKYIPGARNFWLYFVVSAPLLIFVFLLTFLIQLAIEDDAGWSIEALAKKFTLRKAKISANLG